MQRKFDFFTLFLILAIGSLSLLITFAVNRQLFGHQLFFWGIGLFFFYVASHLDHFTLQKIAVPLYVLSVITLIVLFFAGDPIRGSIRWIDLGFFRFQPSEIAKVATIFLLASFYSTNSARYLKNVIVGIFIVAIPAILVFKQPDLGNALSLIAIWGGISLISGFRLKHMAVLIAIVLFFVFLGFELLSPYQKNRIESFLNPNSDPLGTGYNVIQSQIAAGSGGVFGKGLGRGSQSQLNFLPEAESDFIFASLTEQLGFVGASILLSIYLLLITRLLNLEAKEYFSKLIVAGACSFLIFQFSVNVGMNLGLLPVTGITLPLVSYGGSSLISTLLLLGIVFSIRRNQALSATF